jgi:hypothetical protein
VRIPPKTGRFGVESLPGTEAVTLTPFPGALARNQDLERARNGPLEKAESPRVFGHRLAGPKLRCGYRGTRDQASGQPNGQTDLYGKKYAAPQLAAAT